MYVTKMDLIAESQGECTILVPDAFRATWVKRFQKKCFEGAWLDQRSALETIEMLWPVETGKAFPY